MRSGAAAGQAGIVHDTAFYDSDEQFLDVVLPFLQEGVAAGEPTVSVFGEPKLRLLRDALGPASSVLLIDGQGHYLRPAVAIQRHRQMMAGYVADGATQIRVAGDVPHPGVGVAWEWWARYEAAANRVYDDFPMYALCPYDTRTAPPEVLDHARRTHTHVVTPSGREPSSAFQDPHEFLASALTPVAEPLQARPALVDVIDPSPGRSRQAVAALQALAGLADDDLNGLLISTSEVVTNALVYGRGPLRLQAWADRGRIIVTVTDRGPGPADLTVGLTPGAGPGGYGLWLAHQTCSYVSMWRGPEGFTVRLVAESPGA
ncbi:anti-sigma factor RsbA family regulatory protein [Catellatospora methionotrophica]|uniref:anti-sigma factor RsbA family regulatory protein n=1 Tax=Catellatospora methionotrophica TaxID=121620 RepID=UPI0033EE6955